MMKEAPTTVAVTFRATILQGGKTATGIHVPDDVVAALGTSRRPRVRVTMGDYTYRSTVAPMRGRFMLPVSADVRAGAGVARRRRAGRHARARQRAARGDGSARSRGRARRRGRGAAFFDGLSYTNRLRFVLSVEGAKTPETRQRRIDKAVEALREGRTSSRRHRGAACARSGSSGATRAGSRAARRGGSPRRSARSRRSPGRGRRPRRAGSSTASSSAEPSPEPRAASSTTSSLISATSRPVTQVSAQSGSSRVIDTQAMRERPLRRAGPQQQAVARQLAASSSRTTSHEASRDTNGPSAGATAWWWRWSECQSGASVSTSPARPPRSGSAARRESPAGRPKRVSVSQVGT